MLIFIIKITIDKLTQKHINNQKPSELFSKGLDQHNLSEYCSIIQRVCEELSISDYELDFEYFKIFLLVTSSKGGLDHFSNCMFIIFSLLKHDISEQLGTKFSKCIVSLLII